MSNNVVDLHPQPARPEDDHELIADLCRYAEGVLTEKQVRKRHRLADSVWKSMGEDDLLVERIEAEKIRRVRDGSFKREKAQLHVTKAPDVLESIMMDDKASPKHRIDSAKVLDTFAANGPQVAPAGDRFIITINLTADGSNSDADVIHFNKSIKVDANDSMPAIDTNNIDPNSPQKLFPATTAKKDDDDQGYF
jgi:hypothetical protein